MLASEPLIAHPPSLSRFKIKKTVFSFKFIGNGDSLVLQNISYFYFHAKNKVINLFHEIFKLSNLKLAIQYVKY